MNRIPILGTIAILTLSALTALTALTAHAADPGAVVAAKRTLQAGVDSVSVPAIMGARARFQALSAAEPADAALHEWVAIATWRAALLARGGDAAKTERLVRDGLTHCDEAIHLAPKEGLPLAVKAGLQSMLMRFDPASMMTLGPESQANLERARVLAPNDPRVLLFYGIQTMHKPAAFGGSVSVAHGKFVEAARRFAADSTRDSTGMDWGRDDAYLWAGRAAMALGDFQGAVQLFEQALAANPNNRWVRGSLLPAARDSANRSVK
jgi:tetratricopeptide (TPR) repeat protein